MLRQTPTAGEQVAEGTTIELRVSKGQNLIDVPNVVGLDEGTATDTLTSAGFKVSSVAAFSDQEAGIVVAQNPLGGQAVKGSTVEIQVSQGPELATVPGVIGLSEGDATAALQDERLRRQRPGSRREQRERGRRRARPGPVRGKQRRSRQHDHDLRRPLHGAGAGGPPAEEPPPEEQPPPPPPEDGGGDQGGDQSG